MPPFSYFIQYFGTGENLKVSFIFAWYHITYPLWEENQTCLASWVYKLSVPSTERKTKKNESCRYFWVEFPVFSGLYDRLLSNSSPWHFRHWHQGIITSIAEEVLKWIITYSLISNNTDLIIRTDLASKSGMSLTIFHPHPLRGTWEQQTATTILPILEALPIGEEVELSGATSRPTPPARSPPPSRRHSVWWPASSGPVPFIRAARLRGIWDSAWR